MPVPGLTADEAMDYITDQSVINMPTPDTSTRRRRKDARPQELLDAALSLFVEKGFAATKAEEVAQRAGVSKGTLYLYYPSKQELLKAVISHHLSSRIAEGAAQAAAHGGASSDLLRGMLVDWWSQMYDSPAAGVFKLVITEVCNFPEIADYYNREVVAPAHVLLGSVISQAIARGEFRPVPVDSAVHSLILPLVMICLHRHSLGTCAGEWHMGDGHQFITDHVNLVLAGLAPAATSAAPAEPAESSEPARH